MGKIRIIGGVHRSRQLPVLDAKDLRPTLDRVKETLFNWLGQDLTGKICLDLFAGSGSLGFEASSRNAHKVVMVEQNSKVAQQLRNNIQLLKVEQICQVLSSDAISYLKNTSEKFDVIFLDPPYQGDLLNRALASIFNCLNPAALVYIEYETEPAIPDNLITIKNGKAGTVKYALLAAE
jgi:16S rRNA (guanine966-N2)-methyltransferase